MYCFDTALDDNGLDICMTCFQAFSRSGYNHTKQHAQLCHHNIFLNYRKTLKPQDISKQPKKMLKLEVKEQSEDELFDVKTSIYVASANASVEYPDQDLPLKVSESAKAILKATSSENKQQIKAWTQDIKACKHSSNIEQTESSASLHRCSDCGLEENLWLCLECGHVGCGRKQFGGVPGNSHAVEHYKTHPTHHIAVKLGSLSSDSADCYCYTCDDDVKVPNLAKCLSTYGIQLSEHVKTEKTLTELQIEQNEKWDFDMSDDDGQKLVPVFGKGFTGFKNLGNSCYLASVLQAMFSVPEFANAYFDSANGIPESVLKTTTDPANNLSIQMFKLGDGLLSGRYSIPDTLTTDAIKYQRGIKPSSFKSLIGKGHSEFSTMQQQDAYEFWTYLVDQLEKHHISGRGSNVPTDVFKYVVENKLKCTNCHGVRIKRELAGSICLPVEGVKTNDDGSVSLNDCFAEWHKAATVDDFNCPKCHAKYPSVVQQGFVTYPSYLVVSPQRIRLKNWVPEKLSVAIKFAEQLNLEPYISQGKLDSEVEIVDEDTKEDDAPKIVFKDSDMEALGAMGFGADRCKRALYNTANSGAEAAANWLFEHMDDPGIDDPFEIPTASKKQTPTVKQDDVENLMSMGFSSKLATKALVINGSNLEQCVDWLFAHPNDDGELPKKEEPEETAEQTISKLLKSQASSKKYELLAVVCHKGSSIHCGHYVAFIKKLYNGIPKWILFNDEKVVLATETNLKEIEVSSYLYIYKKI